MKPRHLNDEQFAEALHGAASETVAAHIEQCGECQAELGRVRGALGRVAAWSQATAAEPMGFWYAQRQAIAERIEARRQPSRLWSWAVAVATVVLVAFLLTQVPPPDVQQLQAQVTDEVTRDRLVDPDDALLAEIEASLRRPVPRPFEPALLVTQELHRAVQDAETHR